MSKMIREMQAKKPVQMDFPTLPTDCVRYVWFDPTESEDDSPVFKKMKASYDKMMDLALSYAKTSFEEMMLSRNYLNERPADFQFYPEKHKYAILRKEKYFFKYHHFCGTFYAKASSYANQISDFLLHAIAFQVPTSVDLPGFKKFIQKKFDDNAQAKSDLFRYKALHAKLQPIISKQAPRPPTHNDVQSAMEYTVPYVNSFIKYCPQSSFDDSLYKHLVATKKIDQIKEVAKTIGEKWKKCADDVNAVQQQVPRDSKRPMKRSERLLNIDEIDDAHVDASVLNMERKAVQAIDLVPLRKVIDGIVSTFKTNENHKIIIVCALYRIFFDEMYILYPRVMFDYRPNQMFFNNCNKFRYMTPGEIGITEGIFTDQQKMQPFTTIDSTVKTFHQAVEFIMVTQFYTNPLDIVYSLYNSSQKFNLIMKRNSLEPKMGVLVSVIDEESIAKLKLAMSFDDFFTIFYAAISISPPSNSVPIRDFLVAFSQVKTEPSMAYAASLFSAGVSLLQSEVKSTPTTQNIPRPSDDPLELKK